MKQAVKLASLALLLLNAYSRFGVGAMAPQAPGQAEVTPASGATIKVQVNLVVVELSVRDERGHAVGDLKQDDFRVLDQGMEQRICAFHREELPLAVALVVDNSASIAAALQELRVGALDTLALLGRDDQVAIFSFSDKPEMVEGLTSDHEALSVDLWALSPWGGTDIDDALYEAARYLGRAAHGRRHAVILVSDNEPSAERTHNKAEVVHAALQSGTPIYSIKVGYLPHSRWFLLTHPEKGLHEVEEICQQTGGAMIDTRRGVSVTSAMETIFTWLKQGYTLGYSPTNLRYDGAYHTIEVRLTQHREAFAPKCTVYAQEGYYAPNR
jgi:Ca-activated chloride channel family protein